MNVAIVQAALTWENVPDNLARFDQRVRAIEGAELIVLPEMFASGFTMRGKEQVALFHEAIRQRLLTWAREKESVVMGSTVCEENGRYYNRLLVAFPGGEVLHYDKRHGFSMAGENEHFTPGHEHLVFEYKGVRIMPLVCYDLRFPAWSRNTCDYDLAIYVASWPEARRLPWQILLKARAIENQCYVVGVNRVGMDGNGAYYAGDSVILSPRGEELVACEPYVDEVRQVNIDLLALRALRAKFPVLEDRDKFTIEI